MSETARLRMVVSFDLRINNGGEATEGWSHLGTVNHLIIGPTVEAQKRDKRFLLSFAFAVMTFFLE